MLVRTFCKNFNKLLKNRINFEINQMKLQENYGNLQNIVEKILERTKEI